MMRVCFTDRFFACRAPDLVRRNYGYVVSQYGLWQTVCISTQGLNERLAQESHAVTET